MIRAPLLLAFSLLALALLPSAAAIPGACDTPPGLPPGGLVNDAYNGARDTASGACHGVVDTAWAFVVGECETQFGPLCPL